MVERNQARPRWVSVLLRSAAFWSALTASVLACGVAGWLTAREQAEGERYQWTVLAAAGALVSLIWLGGVLFSTCRREAKNRVFTVLCWATACSSVVVLGVLLVSIAWRGVHHLNWEFITASPSRHPEEAGLGPALWGSIWICAVCAVAALPIGIGTAIFLEEFKPRRWWARKLHGFVQLNISNLAGVPSIVYGIIGLTVFVQLFNVANSAGPLFEVGIDHYDQVYDESGMPLMLLVEGPDAPQIEVRSGMTMYTEAGDPVEVTVVPAKALPDEPVPGTVVEDAYVSRFGMKAPWAVQVPFGRTVLAGGLTLMLVILPIVIISAQEALRAVPNSLREAALAQGATRWQMVWKMTLPAAVPGIMTGSILAMSRAIGEAAPILIIAGIVFIRFTPENLMSEFTAMPLQIYNWASRPQEEFYNLAATGIIVLLAVLLTFNATAVFIRQKFQKSLQ